MADDNPSGANPEEQGASSAEGTENVEEGTEGQGSGESEKGSSTKENSSEESQQDAASLSLEELNNHLGKNFKDKESALKSLKDTQNYVGKVGQKDVEGKKQEVQEAKQEGDDDKVTQLESQLNAMQNELFFSQNEKYKPYRETIEKLSERMNDTPSNVVETDEFKSIFEKMQGYDELQKSKSVLESNPRIGQATDSMKKAREAQQAGNDQQAKSHAVRGVLDAYEK